MALRIGKPSAAMLSAAALSLLATPASAVGLPLPAAAKAYDPSVETVERHRRHHHDDGIDAGDILAGVLILGGIAAIAGAVEKSEREDRYPPPPATPPRYRGVATTGSYQGSLGRAVDLCVGEVERGFGEVGAVDAANRTGEGWQVSGELASGRAWSCWIDGEGRVSGVDLADGYDAEEDYEAGERYEGSYVAPPADGQWSDEAYSRARARIGQPGEYGG